MSINKDIIDKAKSWLSESFDEETRSQVKYLLDNDHRELVESFYKDLEFGTGGLRGIMGVGTNRMNKYTVGVATQGLANYLKKSFSACREIKVAIAYDCRNLSDYFARIASEVLSANGIKVHLFDSLRPTPLLSFAIRYLNCQSGIVITASHNPKEYNGYKAYWEDGGQVVSPHDKNIVDEVKQIESIKDVKFNKVDKNIIIASNEVDQAYLEKIKTLIISPDIISKHKDLKIVFTPIHGSAVKLGPEGLKAYGFENVISVKEQDVVDGNFPTVFSPNPEEPAALEMALNKARETGGELVLGTDPDGDRVGVIVKNLSNEYVFLSGNQIASLIIFYLLNKYKEKNLIKGNEYIVKTIVTTDLLKVIADNYGVECYETLTGFKFIADIIRKFEGEKKFIGGGEESYGYLVGDFVRDKDAIISCCVISEIAAWAKEQNKTLYELMIDVYLKFGFFKEKLISFTKKGKEGYEEIQKIMEGYRNNPPKKINGSLITEIIDYARQKRFNIKTGKEYAVKLPVSNVLQLLLEDGSKITMRPSGTEPKIKFYFAVKSFLNNPESFKAVDIELEKKIDEIINDLKIN